MINKKKLVSSQSMRKQYFVANNLFGEGGSMQLTVMSEGLLLNAKCIIGSRGAGGGRGGEGSSFPHTATSCNCLP